MAESRRATRDSSQLTHRLLALVGTSPQVVTETIQALFETYGIVLSEIHVVTTTKGAEVVRRLLGRDGAIARLRQELGVGRTAMRATENTVHVIEDRLGCPIDDLRTERENLAAGTFILGLVRELTERRGSAVHFSLAGGRKTMSASLALAVQILARPQDRLYHVLVDPPEVESHPDFFFKPRQPVTLNLRDGSTVSTEDVRVELARIPFLRLREHALKAMPALTEGEWDWAAVVEAVQRLIPPAAPLVATVLGERLIELVERHGLDDAGSLARVLRIPPASVGPLLERVRQARRSTTSDD